MTGGPDDPTPDPRLLAALRHAPDSDLQPDAALGDALRRAARAAIAPPAPAWWRRWLTAIDPGRHPALAGVLGGVLIAGVVVGLWKDQPMPAAVEPVVVGPSPSPPPEVTMAPVPPAPAAPPVAAATESAAEPSGVRPPPAPAPGGFAKRAAPAAERPPPNVAAAPPAVAPAPREEAAAPPPAAALALERDVAPAQAAQDRAGRARSAAAPAIAEPRAAPASMPTPALLLALREPPAGAAATASIAPRADSAAWSWARVPAEPQPLDDAARAWFAQLDRATDGRWRRIEDAPAEGPATVSLRRGDAQASVRVLAAAVIWRENDAVYRADVAVPAPPPAVTPPARAASAR